MSCISSATATAAAQQGSSTVDQHSLSNAIFALHLPLTISLLSDQQLHAFKPAYDSNLRERGTTNAFYVQQLLAADNTTLQSKSNTMKPLKTVCATAVTRGSAQFGLNHCSQSHRRVTASLQATCQHAGLKQDSFD
jgi:hypothetical protein